METLVVNVMGARPCSCSGDSQCISDQGNTTAACGLRPDEAASPAVVMILVERRPQRSSLNPVNASGATLSSARGELGDFAGCCHPLWLRPHRGPRQECGRLTRTPRRQNRAGPAKPAAW